MLYKYKLSLTPKFESAYPCPIIQPYYIHDQEDIYNVEANYLANSIYITNKSEGITNPGLFQETKDFLQRLVLKKSSRRNSANYIGEN